MMATAVAWMMASLIDDGFPATVPATGTLKTSHPHLFYTTLGLRGNGVRLLLFTRQVLPFRGPLVNAHAVGAGPEEELQGSDFALSQSAQSTQNVNAEHSNAEHSNGGRSNAERSNAERSNTERSNAESSHAERSNAERSNAERSNAERSNAERLNSELNHCIEMQQFGSAERSHAMCYDSEHRKPHLSSMPRFAAGAFFIARLFGIAAVCVP